MNRYLYILLIFLLLPHLFSQNTDKISYFKDESEKLRYLGLDTQRIDDQIYILESKYDSNEFSDINLRIKNIETLFLLAINNYEEVIIIRNEIINDSDYNTNNVWQMFDNLNQDMILGRYEESIRKIDSLRVEMNNLKSLKMNAIISSKEFGSSLSSFVYDNRYYIITIILSLLLLFIIIRKHARIYFLKIKIIRLNNKKSVLINLIKKVQQDYFKNNSIDEVQYNIKYLHLEHLVNEIDKEIAIVNKDIILYEK